MQLIFDNIIASMVGGMILLSMVAINHRQQVSAAESAGFYMLQQQVLDFTQMVQRDMANIRRPENISKTDSSFVFLAQTSPTDTTRRAVEYRRVKTGYRGKRPTFRIDRYVDGTWAGGSTSSLVGWRMIPLTESGGTPATRADVRAVRIVIEAASPIDLDGMEGVSIRGTRWEATFRPRFLRDTP